MPHRVRGLAGSDRAQPPAGVAMADERALRAAADGHMARRNYKRAEKLYRELVQRVPKDPQLRVRHAELLRRLEQPQLAARAYRKATELFLAIGLESRAKAAWALAIALDSTLTYPVSDSARPPAAAAPAGPGYNEDWKGRAYGLALEPEPEPVNVIVPPPPPPIAPDLIPEDEFNLIYARAD